MTHIWTHTDQNSGKIYQISVNEDEEIKVFIDGQIVRDMSIIPYETISAIKEIYRREIKTTKINKQ